MEKLKISPFVQASRDISDYLKTEGLNTGHCYNEIWVVYPTLMNSKYTRSLNNKLGIHLVNKCGERMRRYK